MDLSTHPAKRKAHHLEDPGDLSEVDSVDASSANEVNITTLRIKKPRLASVIAPELLHAPSLYAGWHPPKKPVAERTALEGLLASSPTEDDEEYIYVTLSEFWVYRPLESAHHAGTMAPLSDLLTRQGNSGFLFDGTISRGKSSYFVRNVPFTVVSVEGYDEDSVSVREGIYLQSTTCAKSKIWYQISQPAKHYKRFHDGFLWLADFTKHFICFMLGHSQVCLQDFTFKFDIWMENLYKNEQDFREWRDQFPRKDFRTVVVNNFEYLWKESTSLGVDDESHNKKQPIWKEIDPKQLEAVPRQKVKELRTTVTPYVFNLFQHMYFGDQLESRTPASTVTWEFNQAESFVTKTTPAIHRGDVICLPRDEAGNWKDKELTWYAYVHDIEKDERRNDSILHLFWLYRPSDTTCGSMRYPYEKELFFSDHCNCLCEKTAKVYASDIEEKLSVTMFATEPVASTGSCHFIRQTYLTEDDHNHFVTLQKRHLRCQHRTGSNEELKRYTPGETVLVKLKNSLEPVEVVDIIDRKHIHVRKLLRMQRDLNHNSALPNELIYTHLIRAISTSSVVRKCHIRFYKEKEEIPAPYCYGGVGDCWIITSILEQNIVVPLLDSSNLNLMQGFDPITNHSPLSVLDLFCGGGSFGRGIEEGGIAKVRWAVDYDEFAIHTKRANLKNLKDTQLFFGSAVDYFAQSADDAISKLIAAVGEVDIIIAGSPCQGFSLAQKATSSDRSRKNASMVALVVAFIDLHRPKYALLENVFGMTRKFGPNKDEDVFAQIVCALVGLGYQVQYFVIDAFSHGGAQNRSRIFISIAAPGLTPLSSPPATHSGPPTILSRGIGKSLAGVKFGVRQFGQTPFPYVSALEATKDLPSIGDGNVGICIPFPDHRVSRMAGFKQRVVIPWIPIYPSGSFVEALQAGKLPRAVQDLYTDRINSMALSELKIFRRLPPDRLFDTCTTACKVDDARDGRWLHWNDHRAISIAEAKRAQSFPDAEPLIGLPAQQWKLIGNGVSRYVAAAWGVSLRMSVLANSNIKSIYHEHVCDKTTATNMEILLPAMQVTSRPKESVDKPLIPVVVISKQVPLGIIKYDDNFGNVPVHYVAMPAIDSDSDSDSDDSGTEDTIKIAQASATIKTPSGLSQDYTELDASSSSEGERQPATRHTSHLYSMSPAVLKQLIRKLPSVSTSISANGNSQTSSITSSTSITATPSQSNAPSTPKYISTTSPAPTDDTPNLTSTISDNASTISSHSLSRSNSTPFHWPKSSSTADLLIARVVAKSKATYATSNDAFDANGHV